MLKPYNIFIKITKKIKTFTIITLLILICQSFFICQSLFALQAKDLKQKNTDITSYSLLEGVAATVNDKIISTYDMKQRAKMIAVFSGTKFNKKFYKQVRDNILKILIEEKLMLQNAAKYEIKIKQERINQRIAQMASQIGVSQDDFINDLNAKGISTNTLESQIKAELAWQTIIRGLYANKIKINNHRVINLLTEIKENSRKRQYLLSEICLSVPSPDSVYDIFNNGLKLIEAISQGTSFQLIAQNYSSCPSAASGGDLGWVTEDELTPELASLLRKVAKGSITKPIPIKKLLKIILIRNINQPSARMATIFKIAYVASTDKSKTSKDNLSSLLNKDICTSSKSGFANISITKLNNLGINDIVEHFRKQVINLYDNEYTKIVQTVDGFEALKVCTRNDGNTGLTKTAVKNRLFSEQLELLARRHLRNLKRSTAINIRLNVKDLTTILET